jgi:hypothetical protein
MTGTQENTLARRIEIPLVWDSVGQVRLEAGILFSNFEPAVRDAAVMVASELTENIVKYGAPLDGQPVGFVSFELDGDNFTISSHNAVAHNNNLQAVQALLDQISDSEDPRDLSLARLRQLIEGKIEGPSQLGLLRVATDGGCEINHSYANAVLTIVAEHKTQ